MYNLIIIEDEINIRNGIITLLDWTSIGFHIEEHFSNGLEALEYLRNNDCDVILTDIHMPKLNGLELIAELSLLKSKIKIVLLSGYADFEYARAAMKNNVRHYLLKPIKYDEIVSAFVEIREELDTEKGVNHLTEHPTGYYEKIIEAGILYVQNNIRTATLENVALSVKLSPNYFSKIFKQCKGQNFSNFIFEERMKLAAQLLGDIDLKTYEISFAIGYDNPKNFTRAFKQYYSKTPREYRERGN